jgi:hypothetical protein
VNEARVERPDVPPVPPAACMAAVALCMVLSRAGFVLSLPQYSRKTGW